MGLHSLFPPAELRYGLISVSASFTVFHCLNIYLNRLHPPEHIASKGSKAVWNWRNIMVSWTHAMLIGAWDITCFYYYPELMNDLVDHVLPFTYHMVAISTGYFLLDFWDMYTHGMLWEFWEVTLHHFAVLGAFIYNVITVRYIAYTVVALLAEVNSFFLHSRKLMKMHRVPTDSFVYRINAYINLISFFCCRGFCLCCITYGMYSEPHRMSFFYRTVLVVSMSIMNLLNPVFFWRLLINDFVRSPPNPPEAEQGCNGTQSSVNHLKLTPSELDLFTLKADKTVRLRCNGSPVELAPN